MSSSYFSRTHMFLGEMLYNSLEEQTLQRIHAQTGVYNFKIDSVWADKVKANPKYKWSYNLHFIDMYNCSKGNIGNHDFQNIVNMYCKDGCIYDAILNMTNSLRDNNYNQRLTTIKDQVNANEQMKFLLHFLQDIHQPMHLLGYERGGNDYRINLYKDNHILHTNMHTLWDSILPEHYIQNDIGYDSKAHQCDDYALVKSFNSMTSYKNELLNVIENIYTFGCRNIYIGRKRDIVFDDYYNKTDMEFLFKSYCTFARNTMLFVSELKN
uniref:Uncharacterized protein n=1 Tax=viral metagenome TaxID=1070528 RepID=A0A6C0E0U8_9ZZZZ